MTHLTIHSDTTLRSLVWRVNVYKMEINRKWDAFVHCNTYYCNWMIQNPLNADIGNIKKSHVCMSILIEFCIQWIFHVIRSKKNFRLIWWLFSWNARCFSAPVFINILTLKKFAFYIYPFPLSFFISSLCFVRRLQTVSHTFLFQKYSSFFRFV